MRTARVQMLAAVSALVASCIACGNALAGQSARPSCAGHAATIVGGSGGHVLHGTPARDVIVGGGGDDRIYGGGGNDLICAGTGSDFVDGGAGTDTVIGGGGADVCLRVERRTGCHVDKTPPKLLTVSVNDAQAVASFDEPITALLQPYDYTFSVEVNGVADPVRAARIVDRTFKLTLERPVLSDDDVEIGWKPDAFSDLSGNGTTTPPVAASNETETVGCNLSTMAVNGLVAGSGVYPGSSPLNSPYRRPVGELHAVMLFVDFDDAPGSTGSLDMLYHGFADPVQTWYPQVSAGRLHVTVTPLLRWVRMSKLSSAYGLTRIDSTGRELAYVREAIIQADPFVDFRGTDIVYVVASPESFVGTAPSLSFNTPIASPDGAPIYAATSEPGGLVTRTGGVPDYVFTHETGHMLGLPDLYDIDASVMYPQHRFTGYWDLMGEEIHARGLFAWQRWELGWLDPNEIRCAPRGGSMTATLAPLETAGGSRMLVVPTGPSTALVVENRQRLGEDSGLCYVGAVVYVIDNTIHSGAGPIHVVPAHDDTGVDTNRCGLLARAPLNPGDVVTDAARHITVSVTSSAADGSLTLAVQRG